MNQTNVAEEFDWVTERAKCTPFKVFEVLRAQVEEDMKKRNVLASDALTRKTFSFTSNANLFAVSYNAFGTNKGIIFQLTETGVDINDIESRENLYRGILTLSNEGRCLLVVAEVEYNFWQFRKLALHELFFVNREVVP